MTAICVRREKAVLSSGCKSHPANAPAGSNRSSHGGDESFAGDPLGSSQAGTKPTMIVTAGAASATRRYGWIEGPSVQFFAGTTLAHVASKSRDACS